MKRVKINTEGPCEGFEALKVSVTVGGRGRGRQWKCPGCVVSADVAREADQFVEGVVKERGGGGL